MRKYLILFTLVFVCGNAAYGQWQDDKYSMFVHFGLYSKLGGVWQGEPVRQGYSEQIQSFAGIFSDWYAATAYDFDPDAFDADAIAELALEGGMRSVVFTSKHHDGFCLFDTGTTSYNSVDMTPSGRDYVREMSDACAAKGLRFGLYFSLIDWNYPHAYPISSHNADFVTPEHHEFTKAQVRELLTSYGPISELWFDMGSLQPLQSQELYSLVKELQPDCLVSGRLGNDVYDFAVMADNKLPQTALQAPWQSAVSMFPETWSYRSWQERGEVKDKVAEKLRTLIEVVSKGGNFLLNIGPASDGSIVPFEADVIRSMGRWLEKNKEAIYGTQPSPFRNDFAWGDVTRKGNVLYLILTGECPEQGYITLPSRGIRSVEGAIVSRHGKNCHITVVPEMFDPLDVKVLKVTYDRPVTDMSDSPVLTAGSVLSWENASPDYSYSCFDYYSNYRSVVGYNWNLALKRPASAVELMYTAEEIGRTVSVQVGDVTCEVVLDGTDPLDLSSDVQLSGIRFGRMRGGTFDHPLLLERVLEWTEMETGAYDLPARTFANYLMETEITSVSDTYAVLDVRSGNGVELCVDGKSMMKHLNPYGTVDRTEKVLLKVHSGRSELLIRHYNRFEDTLCAGVSLSERQTIYRTKIILPSVIRKPSVSVRLSAADRQSPHTDCGLHNVVVTMLN